MNDRHQFMTDGPLLQRQLLPGPPFRVRDLVKIVTGPHAGRWGLVTAVEDYRHLHRVGADNSHLMDFGIMVVLYRFRPGGGLDTERPARAFFPEEIAPLYGAAGDWTKRGRVVSAAHWPRARTGFSEAS